MRIAKDDPLERIAIEALRQDAGNTGQVDVLRVVGTERFEASAERYQWPLGLALLLLLAERVLALRAPGVYDRTHAGT